MYRRTKHQLPQSIALDYMPSMWSQWQPQLRRSIALRCIYHTIPEYAGFDRDLDRTRYISYHLLVPTDQEDNVHIYKSLSDLLFRLS